jgi:phage tail protein X
MNETITIRGEGISVDLLLWRKFGVRGRELVETVFDINPGLAALGPFLPLGTTVIVPPLPAESRTPVKLVTLFSAPGSV